MAATEALVSKSENIPTSNSLADTALLSASALPFVKMQGTGNDFILIDASETGERDFAALSRQLCHRHLGIGGDGLLVLTHDELGLTMRMWNPDGSLSEMCGNGLRCFARYAIDRGLASGKFPVQTGAGELVCEEVGADIRISLGRANVSVDSVALSNPLLAKPYEGTVVSMGNPHLVIFVPNVAEVPLEFDGPTIETLPRFPNRTNVHFVEVRSRHEINVRHWERGAGSTLACGTGMGASVAAGVATGRLDRTVQVNVPGGRTSVTVEDDMATWLTGPAAISFFGEWPQ